MRYEIMTRESCEELMQLLREDKDKCIDDLKQQLAKCREDSFGAGWEAGRDSCSVTGDWTGDYEEWLKEK